MRKKDITKNNKSNLDDSYMCPYKIEGSHEKQSQKERGGADGSTGQRVNRDTILKKK